MICMVGRKSFNGVCDRIEGTKDESCAKKCKRRFFCFVGLFTNVKNTQMNVIAFYRCPCKNTSTYSFEYSLCVFLFGEAAEV